MRRVAPEPKGFTFLQISDSHMGFDKPANPNAKGTLEEAIGRIKAMPAEAGLHDPHRRHHASVEGSPNSTTPKRSSRRPGSTCITCRASTTSSIPSIKLYKERYGRGTKGSG